MTLGEWMHEEEQRLMDGIESWKEFQERENKAESNKAESEERDEI